MVAEWDVGEHVVEEVRGNPTTPEFRGQVRKLLQKYVTDARTLGQLQVTYVCESERVRSIVREEADEVRRAYQVDLDAVAVLDAAVRVGPAREGRPEVWRPFYIPVDWNVEYERSAVERSEIREKLMPFVRVEQAGHSCSAIFICETQVAAVRFEEEHQKLQRAHNVQFLLVTSTHERVTTQAGRGMPWSMNGQPVRLIVETIPVDREGFVDLEALEGMVDETVLVASVMAVNNEIGTIQDLPRIATVLSRHGVLFHCDAAQASCAMDVSYLARHADLISLSGHKMYGPQGIGALYIRRDLQKHVEPIIYGGGQQAGLRSGTVPVPLCVGMAAASEIVGSPEGVVERERVRRLRDSFIELVQDSGFPVAINGPLGNWRHPGNANLRFDGLAAQDILGTLQPRVAASTGAACTSGIPEPSHVLRALGLSTTQAESSVRFSFGRFTTDEEVQEAARLVIKAAETLTFATA